MPMIVCAEKGCDGHYRTDLIGVLAIEFIESGPYKLYHGDLMRSTCCGSLIIGGCGTRIHFNGDEAQMRTVRHHFEQGTLYPFGDMLAWTKWAVEHGLS